MHTVNPKWMMMYLDYAIRAAQESHAVRLKVGAIFVSPNGVMCMGINGMPEGGTNECEFREYMDPSAGGWLSPDEIALQWPYIERVGEFEQEERRYCLVTKPECLHAEENLFAKLMKQGVSTIGGKLFMTHSPCPNCAKLIERAGITHVFYIDDYRLSSGPEYLRSHGVKVAKLKSGK